MVVESCAGNAAPDPNIGRTSEGTTLTDIFRVTSRLIDRACTDLSRRHTHALERVGFIYGRPAALGGGILMLAESYSSVSDEDYIPTDVAGAQINSHAIRVAMERCLSTGECAFHVHMHTRFPMPSRTDWREWRKFVPDFFNVQGTGPHGAIILSRTAANGWFWPSKRAEPQPFQRFEIVGMPLKLFEALT